MNEPAICPSCGSAIPPDAPEGVCPACSLGRGLGIISPSNIAAEEAAFRKAEMETLAAAFPQFELIELLGRGGMGEVYKARQKKLGRLVAIKILPEPFGKSDEYTERFLREARSLALLNHPSIVTIYDYGEVSELCYFVMEYIDGADLRQLIEARALTPAEALRIVPQICDALQFAHDAGVVHRDIKPANILIDKRGRVKIADFGLAKIVSKEPKDFTLTGAGEVMGTAEYMAPEQRRSSQTVDHRADIYSLGVVFYEMLTGEVPMGKFDPPSKRVQIDVRLDDVVLRTLEREPERRYQKASQVKTSVEEINKSASFEIPRQTSSPVHRFPISFVLLSSVVFAVAWTAMLALWNLRSWGFWLGSALMFVVLCGELAIGRKWFPVIALNWKRDTALMRAVRWSIVLAQCVAGYYLVLSGMLNIQERTQWRFPYRNIEDFAEKTKGEEYKLVRQLTAYQQSIPKVELAMTNFSWTRGLGLFGPSNPSIGLYPTWGAYFLVGFGLVLLANAVNAAAGTRLWGMRMDPAWRVTKWPIASIGLAIAAGWFIQEEAMLIASLGPRAFSIHREARVKLPIAEVRKRLERSIQEGGMGFVTGESGEWRMNTVPEGKAIGSVAFVNVWKSSPYDRWHWRRGSLQAASPQILVLYVASDEPVETKVQVVIHWPNVSPPQREVDELANALINAVGS
jgi:tRNA A-37 threonylcarbamoyl transferase component Bud32